MGLNLQNKNNTIQNNNMNNMGMGMNNNNLLNVNRVNSIQNMNKKYLIIYF